MSTTQPMHDEAMSREQLVQIVHEARREGVRADLHGANLRWADLRGADLRWANLSEADLHGSNLSGADLHGADLRGADLRWANLHGANLREADLHGANLRGADLRWADLHGANLRGANLRWANLRGADLRWANLHGANLRGADLREADLHGANLHGWLVITGLPSGPLWYGPTEIGWRISIGCYADHTLDELRALIETDEGWPEAEGDECARRRPGLLAAIALCEAHEAQHPGLADEIKRQWEAVRGGGVA